jgi:hypothetical protein
MDANIVLGWALLGLALVTGSFFAAIVVAASEERAQRAGTPLYGRRTRGALARPGTGPPAESRAHCYYDCMSGFHWSSDWGGWCSEGCSVSGQLPRG